MDETRPPSVFAELEPPYSTIVADPPWPYEDAPMGDFGGGRLSRFLPYSTMSLPEIAALPVRDLGAVDAHLALWTTQRFIWAARKIAEGWGFDVGPILTWCKEPMGKGGGGAFTPTTEFVLVGRRRFGAAIAAARVAAGLTCTAMERAVRGKRTGIAVRWEESASSPTVEDWERLSEVLGTAFAVAGPPLKSMDTTWFQWPRRRHSQKPDQFGDLIEATMPGPYVELFARAPRLGWDSWGRGYEITEAAS